MLLFTWRTEEEKELFLPLSDPTTLCLAKLQLLETIDATYLLLLPYVTVSIGGERFPPNKHTTTT